MSSHPFVLRLSGKDVTLSVLEHRLIADPEDAERKAVVRTLVRHASLRGDHLRRVLPVIRIIIARVVSEQQVPLELHSFLPLGRITHRGDLPLDEEAGYKLALLFRLAAHVRSSDCVELMARRIEKCTREEAGYLLSRLVHFGEDAGRFAAAGLRILLGGVPGDAGVERLLDRERR